MTKKSNSTLIESSSRVQIAKAKTMSEERPNFEDIQTGAANCRRDLNKEKPKIKIVHVLSVVEHNTILNKFILHTELGFTE
jgi:hypothetical protein